jgi:hypothetical protein
VLVILVQFGNINRKKFSNYIISRAFFTLRVYVINFRRSLCAHTVSAVATGRIVQSSASSTCLLLQVLSTNSARPNNKNDNDVHHPTK